MCKCRSVSACVRGWGDEAQGASPEAEVLPEQTQECIVYIDLTMLSFPALAGLYLAVLWSGKSVFPFFSPCRCLKTLEIPKIWKYLQFLSTLYV